MAAQAGRHAQSGDAGSVAYYGFHATWDAPSSTAFLALGLRDAAPYVLRVRALALQAQLHEGEIFNPELALAGRFDFAFVLVYLVPLFLITRGFPVLVFRLHRAGPTGPVCAGTTCARLLQAGQCSHGGNGRRPHDNNKQGSDRPWNEKMVHCASGTCRPSKCSNCPATSSLLPLERPTCSSSAVTSPRGTGRLASLAEAGASSQWLRPVSMLMVPAGMQKGRRFAQPAWVGRYVEIGNWK